VQALALVLELVVEFDKVEQERQAYPRQELLPFEPVEELFVTRGLGVGVSSLRERTR
jgi:hypothetical protein